MIKHRFPTLITPEEEDAQIQFLSGLEATVDDMVADAVIKAYEIGGSFRGPGFRVEVEEIFRRAVARIHEWPSQEVEEPK